MLSYNYDFLINKLPLCHNFMILAQEVCPGQLNKVDDLSQFPQVNNTVPRFPQACFLGFEVAMKFLNWIAPNL